MIDQDLLNLIPQRPPFVMLDGVIDFTDTITISSFTIPEAHLFVVNGAFTAPGLIENMAQTAAAGSGSRAMREGKKTPAGFIGALKGLEVLALPTAGDKITTTITLLHSIMNAQIVFGHITCNEKDIAKCELKIFLEQS